MRNIVSPLDGFGSPFGRRFGSWSPLALFAASEQGVWYDPSDFSTMFQDSAGTTPVTAVEQTVGLILDKSQGLDPNTVGLERDPVAFASATTPSAAGLEVTGDIDVRVRARLSDWTPGVVSHLINRDDGGTHRVFQFRVETTGLLTFIWFRSNSPVTKTSTIAPTVTNGETLWLRVTLDVDNGATGNDVKFYTSTDGISWTQLGATVTTAGVTSIDADPAPVRVAGFQTEAGISSKVYRAIIKSSIDGTTVLDFDPTIYTTGSTFVAATGETWTIVGSNARIVPDGNHASQATSGSRPVLKEDGGKYFLLFDGTDDSMATAAIDFSATDEMSVFAGVRKLSDAALAYIASLSNGGTYTFAMCGPAGATASYLFQNSGSATQQAIYTNSAVAAPNTSVLTGIGDISGDNVVLRGNGVQIASSAGDQGTGNYLNAILHIGQRSTNANRFTGRLYSLIVRGKASTADEITAAETWVNSKTGAY